MDEETLELETGLAGPNAAEDRPRILCVDDDPNILSGFRRHLRKGFCLFTANGPAEGLAKLAEHGPFAVVVSDFQMPGMDGVQFLTKVRTIAPETVRILLTAQADVSVAMAAVNQGNTFRFLLKPCLPFVLEKVLRAGVEHHNLLVAERKLTKETIVGCVRVLIELFGTVVPEALGRARRVHKYVQQMALEMELVDGSRAEDRPSDHLSVDLWQLEVAAMLSQLGWLTLPPALLTKAAKRGELSSVEAAEVSSHVIAAGRQLQDIPRLEAVSRMVERQQLTYADLASPVPAVPLDPVDVCAMIIRVARKFDFLRLSGLSNDEALREMTREEGLYLPDALTAIASIARRMEAEEVALVPALELQTGMRLEEDLKCRNGMVLLGFGQTVTDAFVERLQRSEYDLSGEHQCRARKRYT